MQSGYNDGPWQHNKGWFNLVHITNGVDSMEKRTFKTLSIVVPVYNEDHYLDAVISKVIAQPLPDGLERELILVNDVSQDATWDIMRSLPG